MNFRQLTCLTITSITTMSGRHAGDPVDAQNRPTRRGPRATPLMHLLPRIAAGPRAVIRRSSCRWPPSTVAATALWTVGQPNIMHSRVWGECPLLPRVERSAGARSSKSWVSGETAARHHSLAGALTNWPIRQAAVCVAVFLRRCFTAERGADGHESMLGVLGAGPLLMSRQKRQVEDRSICVTVG
jgi:hypothetical protein